MSVTHEIAGRPVGFLGELDTKIVKVERQAYKLFVFEVESCLHTVTAGHGDPAPHHRIWRAA